MNRKTKKILLIIGCLLSLVGILNIIDDTRVLTYDISAILAGIGFLVIGVSKKG